MSDNRYRRTADGYLDLDQFPDEELGSSETEFLTQAMSLLTADDKEQCRLAAIQATRAMPASTRRSPLMAGLGRLMEATKGAGQFLMHASGSRIPFAAVSLVIAIVVLGALVVTVQDPEPLSTATSTTPRTSVTVDPPEDDERDTPRASESDPLVTVDQEPPIALESVADSVTVPNALYSLAAIGNQLVVGGTGQDSLYLIDQSDLSSLRLLYEGQDNTAVWDMAVVSDGSIVLVGSNGSVRRVDPSIPSAGHTEVPNAHEGDINAVVALPSGEVATAGEDGQVLVLDPSRPDGGTTNTYPGGAGGIRAIAALPDGRIAFGGAATTVTVWDTEGTGQVTTSPSFQASIAAIAVLDGDQLVVAAGHDIFVWNHKTDVVSGPFSLHDEPVKDVVVTPSSRIISGSSDGRVLLWDPAAPGVYDSVAAPLSDDVIWDLAVLSDGRLAVVDFAGTITILTIPSEPRWPGAETQIGFFRYTNAASQACADNVGRHGQQVTVNGTSYVVQEATMLVSTQSDGDGRPIYVGTEPDRNELLIGTAGADALNGDGGDDILCGLGGDDYLTGRAGDDILIGGAGLDISLADHGPDGQDLILADEQDFELPAAQGFPTWGDPPNRDELTPEELKTDYCFPWRDGNFSASVGCNQPIPADPSIAVGFTTIIDGAKDACRSAAGRHGEAVNFNGTEYIIVELSAIEPSNTQDPALPKYLAFAGIEQNNILIGTDGAEGFDGGAGNDIICGLGGDDAIAGGDGDDILIGGDGTDEFTGGSGSDLLSGDEDDLSHVGIPFRCDFPSEDGDIDYALPDAPDRSDLCRTPE